MYYAKARGTRIAVVNPFRELGLERYWVPSIPRSALVGTRLADDFFLVHTGGDIAFINGVMKHLLQMNAINREFIDAHTDGFLDLEQALDEQSWEDLERFSGVPAGEMRRFAEMYARARTAVFVWSMGITQHRFGVENVKAIVNLALARGMVGRERCGLMPIRGHSGVQGGAEVGCVPNLLPGGEPISRDKARIEALWGFEVPEVAGYNSVEMIEAAARGEMDVFYAVGGNFLETLPEPEFVREALGRVPLRVHEDIVLTTQMLVDPADTVVLLPAQTRYEQRGGGTETSTERRIYFSPEIPGPRVGEAMAEWEILMRVAERTRPESRDRIHFEDAGSIRAEIAKAVPAYAGIESLRAKGDAVQWGGRLLCQGGRFPTVDHRARFTPLVPPEVRLLDGAYLLSTRRGKQFNSMVQRDIDPMLGARRDAVLMNAADAETLGLREGDPVEVRSEVGRFAGRVALTRIKPRNVQMYWPEANAVLRRGVTDPQCGMPDYNAVVTLSAGGRPLEGAR